jgi:O-antigen polymerase
MPNSVGQACLNTNRYTLRGLLVGGILCFVALYQWAYINWLSPTFAYYGFEYFPRPTRYVVLAWMLSVLPSFWMPLTIRRPSQLGYWVLYLTVVIPSMFVPLYVGLDEPSRLAWLMVTLCVGFGICGIGYLRPLHSFRTAALPKSVFWVCFFSFAAICAAWVAIAFRGNIHLVSFSDIYDLRSQAETLLTGTFLNYPLMWLYGAINPFMIASGLYRGRFKLFLAGSLGQLLVFSTLGTKASLLSVLFIVGIYWLFRVFPRVPFAIKFTWGIGAIFVLLCVSIAVTADNPALFVLALAFLVFFRSFGLAGLLSAQYFYFFEHNPYTYYSHLKVINWFLHYPFRYPLGTELGYYYYDPLVDTTAHFWATDGLAALGLPGILLISVICAFLFWFVDSVAKRHDPRFAGMVLFYATYSLANLSLFTTFLSGGLGLLLIFLYFAPGEQFVASPSKSFAAVLPTGPTGTLSTTG